MHGCQEKLKYLLRVELGMLNYLDYEALQRPMQDYAAMEIYIMHDEQVVSLLHVSLAIKHQLDMLMARVQPKDIPEGVMHNRAQYYFYLLIEDYNKLSKMEAITHTEEVFRKLAKLEYSKKAPE